MLMEILNCQIRGLVSHIERKATGWIHMVLGKTDKKTNDLQAQQIMARDVETYVYCIKTSREAKVDRSSTMPEDLRGIYFIDSQDEEFKLTMKKKKRS